MRQIGKIIKDLRIQNNESQNDLAKKLNITFQSVSKWENGISYPDIFMLKEIAKHYNVSIDFLLNNEKSKAIETKEKTFKITLNEESNFCVFDDTKNNLNISYNDKNRHRGPAECKYKVSDDEDKIVFAINKDGRLIYAGYKIGYGYASPSDKTYHDGQVDYLKQECFIIEKNFVAHNEFIRNVKFNYPYNKETYFFTPMFNQPATFSVYTDFEFLNSIAKCSFNDNSRHRCDSDIETRASDEKEDIIIALDEFGKIIYMAKATGYGYGSPSDTFYKNEDIENIKLDCFIIKPTFTYFSKGANYDHFEFVIPKNGYVIVGNTKNQDFCSFLKHLLAGQIAIDTTHPNCFNNIPIGALNDRKIILKENSLELHTIQYQNLWENYEFVVPKGGFIILAKKSNYDTFLLLKELFLDTLTDDEIKNFYGNSLFSQHTMEGQFNAYQFKLFNQQLIITRPISEFEKISLNDKSIDMKLLLNQLEERIIKKLKKSIEKESMEDFCYDLEGRIEDLESRIDDLEGRTDEID